MILFMAKALRFISSFHGQIDITYVCQPIMQVYAYDCIENYLDLILSSKYCQNFDLVANQ